MKINDLSVGIAAHKTELLRQVEHVLSSGWVILGPQVANFESAFASYVGVRHCVGVGNGTDALEFALKALGVGRGDRVATVANAGAYTTTALLAIGAAPFFLDVDLANHNVTLSEVKRAIAASVKTVVVTHLYGLAVRQITEIAGVCAGAGVQLLEDCAQAHGAQVDGRRVGTFGDAAAFSFYPTKNLGALGDGGAVVTNTDEIAECVKRLRQYGWSTKYEITTLGGRNSRLDEIQAAILSVLLPRLDAANSRRREIASKYSSRIRHPQVELPQASGTDYVAHLYVVRSERRDELRLHLRALDIASEVHYPIPDHRQPVFCEFHSQLRLPRTEQLAQEVLTLPCYPEMTEAQVLSVIDAVNDWPA